jgi:hypothetical protein
MSNFLKSLGSFGLIFFNKNVFSTYFYTIFGIGFFFIDPMRRSFTLSKQYIPNPLAL